MASSKAAVHTAIAGNALVMLAKFAAFAATGSGAMLSEGIHSAADVMNQGLLAVGIRMSERDPDPDHPYGFGRARFAWALVSAVGIFFLGAGVTLYHGIHSLLHPDEVEGGGWALATLAVALVVEGGTLVVATRAVRHQAREAGMTLWRYTREGPDPMGVAVLLEDGAAVIGVLVAAIAVGLTMATGSPVWDALGSIIIGVLLGAVAVFLVRKNMDYLLGRAVRPELQQQVLAVLQQQPSVESVHDVKATVIGPDHIRFKAEVEFDGEELARRWLAEHDVDALHAALATPDDLRAFLVEYGEHIVERLGDEIDRIEEEIRQQVPDAQHVDLENN
ncbi:MAG: cation diffusion facilitator family transporter [Deltaproteobacteria bacterium]|nr:MAG: cation diffusion facilitator family transporter [Deltaproteobacteria bacterium]